jgi:hypothetical protein
MVTLSAKKGVKPMSETVKNMRKRERRKARKEQNKTLQAYQKMQASHPDYPAKQLAKLDWRLGKGVGAVRERLRLQEKLSK